MKLFFNKSDPVWEIGGVPINCGRQVQLEFSDVNGARCFVWGRFEIAGGNNPVFYTTFGRVSPELATARFSLEQARGATR